MCIEKRTRSPKIIKFKFLDKVNDAGVHNNIHGHGYKSAKIINEWIYHYLDITPDFHVLL